MAMDEFSLLIGGKAGFGIDKSSAIIGRLLSQRGYRVYIYREYPSLIRGGHTFSIIRASKSRIAAHCDNVDLVVALNQETVDVHKGRMTNECMCLFDSEMVTTAQCGLGLPLGKFLKEAGAPEIMRNTCIIGALAKALGMEFPAVEDVLKKEFHKDVELNVAVARKGYDEAKELLPVGRIEQKVLPLLAGNQAVALGLIKGGLNSYIAYPMTPSSPILHYLAEIGDSCGVDVVHPESEISVVMMALGYAYAGKKAAVGTSGGGFCLMTEGLSLAAMAELPLVIILGQRPGPSTGLPTYSSQTELYFALHAGQGEFTRFIVAPGDAEEAYYWSAKAMQMSWSYQIPSIILTDKNMGEGIFNFDLQAAGEITEEAPVIRDKKSPYQRYAITENGVSPLAYPPEKDAIIKTNSYEHDESGITTEESQETIAMHDKRLRKEKFLAEDVERFKAVQAYGEKRSDVVLVCWGSNKGVCVEVGERLGLRVIQPVVLNPFPVKQFREAVAGAKRLICVESNATGQLATLLRGYGLTVGDTILKYDGRTFSVEELEKLCRGVIR
jgi:2-oxoglutarate/2-oxoacid ferredoxin oxidoreductase subunit alpha